MKKTRVIILVMLASLFFVWVAVAAALDKKHYESNKHVTDSSATCKDCHTSIEPTTAPKSWTICSSCHGDYEKLAERTAKVVPNPHKTHYTDMPCSECHMIHQSSSLKVCQSCHNLEMKVP